MLLTVLGTAALTSAAVMQPRVAASFVAVHSIEADKDSGAGRHLCSQPPDRMGGPEDHKAKAAQDGEHATSRRVVDHQVDAAQPITCSVLPPQRSVLGDLPPAEDHYEYQAYRTFDGRAPPHAMS
ncbi:MAG: hypothetical protein GEV04_18905 [Actinophytocola sp.]|nr:hypothetical protein [Actinophytocola sp.]